jgi:hypothetical protein
MDDLKGDGTMALAIGAPGDDLDGSRFGSMYILFTDFEIGQAQATSSDIQITTMQASITSEQKDTTETKLTTNMVDESTQNEPEITHSNGTVPQSESNAYMLAPGLLVTRLMVFFAC